MTLRRYFDTDINGDTIDPGQYYRIELLPRRGDALRVHEYVSGEDLLACADWFEQHITEETDDDN